MDALIRRACVLATIAKRRKTCKTSLGKTALMKLVYIAQEVYGLDLGYRFNLYTYGPYDSDVMGDIDYAEAIDFLDVHYNAESGYRIIPGTDFTPESCGSLPKEDEQKIEALFDDFGTFNARELELRATIIYVLKDAPSLEDKDTIKRVQKLKPKYDSDEIEEALSGLKSTSRIP